MRVRLLNDHLGDGPEALHGVGRYFLNLVPALRARGLEPTVAILSQPRGPVSLFEAEGVGIHFLPRRVSGPSLGLGERVRFPGFRRDVLRLLSAADVVAAPSRQESSRRSTAPARAPEAPDKTTSSY